MEKNGGNRKEGLGVRYRTHGPIFMECVRRISPFYYGLLFLIATVILVMKQA